MGSPFDEAEDEGTAIIDAKAFREAVRPSRLSPVLVLVAGADAGRLVRLDTEVTIGRSAQCELRVNGDGVSRKHARIFRRGDETLVEDLGSTNGTLLNGVKIEAPSPLSDGDKIQVGAEILLKFSLQDEVDQELQQQLYQAAVRDPLTGAYNRRALMDRLEQDLAHAKRHGTDVVLMLLDLDHFKSVNDTHGHPVGDEVLRRTAEAVRAVIRKEDFFARYGGEEFALLCRSTAMYQGLQLAERVRATIAELRIPLPTGGALEVTTSVGIAQFEAEQDPGALIRTADEALYKAKQGGRNQVVAAP
ncbi:MAG: GGDEF domain-containing protein [Myxococcota bacterium]|nr:GGDEF domain-containing protein [Myxococcota bacterium]